MLPWGYRSRSSEDKEAGGQKSPILTKEMVVLRKMRRGKTSRMKRNVGLSPTANKKRRKIKWKTKKEERFPLRGAGQDVRNSDVMFGIEKRKDKAGWGRGRGQYDAASENFSQKTG